MLASNPIRNSSDSVLGIPSNRPKAIFLDKDGTLIKDVPYNVEIDRIQFSNYALEALEYLHRAGYLFFVITNQSGIARGYFNEQQLLSVEQFLKDALAAIDVPLRGFYYCPHHPKGSVEKYAISCQCRKPEPGLLLRCAREHDVDLARSWMIGDILNDVEAGRKAGCRTVLLDNGNETEWELSRDRLPHHIVSNLLEAAQIILTVDLTVDRVLAEGSR